MAFVASELAGPAHSDGMGGVLRRDERFWLLGLAIVTLCSWGRWLATGSLKVDESYPSEIKGTLLLLVLEHCPSADLLLPVKEQGDKTFL